DGERERKTRQRQAEAPLREHRAPPLRNFRVRDEVVRQVPRKTPEQVLGRVALAEGLGVVGLHHQTASEAPRDHGTTVNGTGHVCTRPAVTLPKSNVFTFERPRRPLKTCVAPSSFAASHTVSLTWPWRTSVVTSSPVCSFASGSSVSL